MNSTSALISNPATPAVASPPESGGAAAVNGAAPEGEVLSVAELLRLLEQGAGFDQALARAAAPPDDAGAPASTDGRAEYPDDAGEQGGGGGGPAGGGPPGRGGGGGWGAPAPPGSDLRSDSGRRCGQRESAAATTRWRSAGRSAGRPARSGSGRGRRG